jgi:hypothetical protein
MQKSNLQILYNTIADEVCKTSFSLPSQPAAVIIFLFRLLHRLLMQDGRGIFLEEWLVRLLGPLPALVFSNLLPSPYFPENQVGVNRTPLVRTFQIRGPGRIVGPLGRNVSQNLDLVYKVPDM